MLSGIAPSVPTELLKALSTESTSQFNVQYSNKVVAFWDTENTPHGNKFS